MRMKCIEFSQTYYLKRAEELGISLRLSTYDDDGNRRDRSVSRNTFNVQESRSVTVSGRTFGPTRNYTKRPFRTEKGRQNSVAATAAVAGGKRRVGDVWDGYVVQAFSQKTIDNSRDWEWSEPTPEIISDVVWSEDEEEERKATQKSLVQTNPKSCGGRIGGVFADGGGKVIAEKKTEKIVGGDGGGGGGGKKPGCDGGNGCGDGVVVSTRNIAPRGKSWMIVTQKMMEEYTS
jgi:hypothetical protein